MSAIVDKSVPKSRETGHIVRVKKTMPKKKKKEAAAPPKKRKPGPARSRGAGPDPGAADFLCSVTNPFCEGARNLRLPFMNNAPTVPYRFRQVATLTSDTNGNIGWSFSPQYPYCYNVGTSIGTNGFTVNASWNSIDPSNLFSGISAEYRITSAGLVLRPMSAPLYQQGMVVVSEIPQIYQSQALTFSPETMARQRRIPLPRMKESCWISSPAGTEAHLFIGFNSATIFSNNDWTSVCVSGTGFPVSTAILEAEMFVCVEFLLEGVSALGAFATRPPVVAPHVVDAYDRVKRSMGDIIEGGIEEVDKFVAAKVGQALRSVASRGAAVVAG